MRIRFFIFLILFMLIWSSCVPHNIRLYPSSADPLREFTLQGKEKGKILVIPIRGVISDAPKEQFFRSKPSMVQELVSQLRRAEKDKQIKAVLLKIDSPGGSVIASDILYNEIAAFKKRTGVKVIVAMMGIVASGRFYCGPSRHDYRFNRSHISSASGIRSHGENRSGCSGEQIRKK